MNKPFPGLPAFLAASLVLHASVLVPEFLFANRGTGEPVEISVVSYAPEPAAPAPKAATPARRTASTKAAAAKKRVVRGMKPHSLEPAAKIQALPAYKPVKRATSAMGAPIPEVPATKGSAELLSDPKKAKVFVGYFTAVKDKLDRTVRKNYADNAAGQGSVCLLFILNSDGSLDSASVVESQTQAPAGVKDFAMRCLRESAPFIGFPRSLEVGKVSFNVTVLFEEL